MKTKNLEEFDKKLLEIDHYIKYPIMMPWIGNYYGKQYKRVLFVGESHYFPAHSKAQMIPEQWYNSRQDCLKDDELDYINTRDVISSRHLKNTIWKNPGQILISQNILPPPESNNVFEWFCFYNFFQRPAQIEGNELMIHELDIKLANEVFRSNVHILKPEVVIFLSSKAWYSSNKDGMSNTIFDFVPHPSSNWWNRKSLKYSVDNRIPLTGREKFEKLVSSFY
jgi:hypothetical protein